MQIKRLRERLKDPRSVYSAFLTIPCSWTAELMGFAGYEVLVVDMQHGLADFSATVSMLQAISGTQAIPMARLPWNDPAMTMHVLDAGAAGVICPMIDTAADTERFVRACRYPPAGYRSFGPVRARFVSSDHFAEPLAFAMIETAAALDNLDSIAAVPGLDGLFIGPNDLSISLGLERRGDFSQPALMEALDRVLEAGRRHGLHTGIFTGSTADSLKLAERGFKMISHGDDTALLREMASRNIAAWKEQHKY